MTGETKPSADDTDQVATMRRRLLEAEERNLNAVDLVRGAEAEATQAKWESEDYFHRLDIRETELRRLKESLGFELETPLDEVLTALHKSGQIGTANGGT